MIQTENLMIKIGNHTICQQLNLTINKREIWGLLGPNGSGKTTLLHTLAGLHPVIQGQLWLYNDKLKKQELKNLHLKTLAQTIGILFQQFTDTFPQTVLDYCKAGRYPHLSYFNKTFQNDTKLIFEALQAMDLHSLAQRSITHLSGGERRRLELACVLAQTPDIYLLDEPTNHLDMRYQIHVLNHFQKLAISHSSAVVMSLHDANLAQQFCTHILLLYPEGHTLYGPKDEILTADNLSRLYQHKINPIYNGVYWQPEFDITAGSMNP